MKKLAHYTLGLYLWNNRSGTCAELLTIPNNFLKLFLQQSNSGSGRQGGHPFAYVHWIWLQVTVLQQKTTSVTNGCPLTGCVVVVELLSCDK
jgi:hypothetical protein